MHVSVSVDLIETAKFRKTARVLGMHDSILFISLFRLWRTVLRQRRDGKLRGWDLGDIDAAAGVNGTLGFSKALVECGWIDETKNGFVIHDWLKHQHYAARSVYDAKRYKKTAS